VGRTRFMVFLATSESTEISRAEWRVDGPPVVTRPNRVNAAFAVAFSDRDADSGMPIPD
jgi:hypothetical protein